MLFYKCLKDKAMNIEINQYSYLSPKKIIINKKKPFQTPTLEWFSYFRHTYYKIHQPDNHLSFSPHSFPYVIKLKHKEEGASMWNRQQVKEQAKLIIKRNYWEMFVVTLIASTLTGEKNNDY